MTYLSEVLADHPLHYWRCADPAGAALNDIGSTRIAMLQQGALFALPYVGPASNGGSAVITGQAFRYSDTFSLSTPVTVEACVWQYYYGGLVQQIVAIQSAAGFTMGTLQITAAGQLQASSSGGNVTDPAVLPRQAWHHVAVAFDNLGAVLYRDGVQVATAAAVTATQNVLSAVGGPVQGAGGNTLAGAVSEVAIYTTKLSAARIAAHYAALDNLASVPVYRPFGTWDATTGQSVSNPEDLSAVLAAVRKTFV